MVATIQFRGLVSRPTAVAVLPRSPAVCRKYIGRPAGQRGIRDSTKVFVAAPQKVDKGCGEHSTVEPQQPVSMGQDDFPSFMPITSIWDYNAHHYGDLIATKDPHRVPAVKDLTYRELYDLILDFAAGLQALGLKQGDKVSLFSENSSRWIVADQGVMMLGAADAVRGALSPAEELAYIATHSQSKGLIVQDHQTLNKVLGAMKQEEMSALTFIVVLWEEHKDEEAAAAAAAPCAVNCFSEVVGSGAAARAAGGFVPYVSGPQDLATLVYTSGTTGHPKGVMLTHGNLRYQIDHFQRIVEVGPGDSSLSLLPPWHIYQRSVAYFLYACGAREVFSNIRRFREDLTAYPPDHFVCVPLVLDTLHAKVLAKLKSESNLKQAIIFSLMAASRAYVSAQRVVSGTDLTYAVTPRPLAALIWAQLVAALMAPLHALAHKLVYAKVRAALGVKHTVISGGGSLASHLDMFFEIIGLTVLNGWGLTETAPVLAARSPDRSEAGAFNVRGTVGPPLPYTSIKAVDPITHEEVPHGVQGVLLARGPGLMCGYWGEEEDTRRAFVDGWFDTGDLGWIAPHGVAGSNMGGHIALTGRAKDTIVLSSGKNIEPQPIEDAVQCSPYIKHVILCGQDKRELGALVFPDEDALQQLGQQQAAAAASKNGSTSGSSSGGGLSDHDLELLLYKEVTKHNGGRSDYHHEDHIAHIKVVRSPLSVESGTLTRTMKPRRPAIFQQHAAELQQLMKLLR